MKSTVEAILNREDGHQWANRGFLHTNFLHNFVTFSQPIRLYGQQLQLCQMSHETRNAGLSILLSMVIVASVSLTARLYKEHHDSQIAQAEMYQTSVVACR